MNAGEEYAQILAYISRLENEVATLRRELARDPSQPEDERTKTCLKCGESRRLFEFGASLSGTLGCQRTCKFCKTKNYLGAGVSQVRASLGIPVRYITAELFALKSDQLATKKLAKQINSTLKDTNETI